jgi:micrococcal nuclease
MAANEATQQATLVRVVDGDMVDVEIEGTVERLSLIGIDTPETMHPREPVQCFGQQASAKAKELLEGRPCC